MKRGAGSEKGVTIIELLIVIMIIGILTAIAYPSYQSYVLKTHRATAKAKLMEVMDQQQNYYVRHMTYSKALKDDLKYPEDPVKVSDGKRYTITAGNCTAPLSTSIAVCVLLTAKALGVQTSDGDLSINSAGGKTPADKW